MIKLDRPTCPNPRLLRENYKYPDNKKALINASYGKCMYCESKITHVYYGDVEHIKPKSIFPALEFSRDNLGYVCAKCNGRKLDKFDKDLPYINPYSENPEEHLIAFGGFIRQTNGSDRGYITISDIGLNRFSLIERRQQKIDSIQLLIDKYFTCQSERLKDIIKITLKEESKDDKEYSLTIKHLIEAHNIII